MKIRCHPTCLVEDLFEFLVSQLRCGNIRSACGSSSALAGNNCPMLLHYITSPTARSSVLVGSNRATGCLLGCYPWPAWANVASMGLGQRSALRFTN